MSRVDGRLRETARWAIGFMPEPEGLALYEAAFRCPVDGPLLEIGTYCGKSAVYLGAAAAATGRTLFTIDHHRGSEEHQPGWEFHDPRLVDSATGRIDTLPCFRRTIVEAGLENVVVGMVGESSRIAREWTTPLAFLFIDGSHTDENARRDYDSWTPHLRPGAILAIHDVFADPAEGGQAPWRIYRRALESGAFREIARERSLRVLQTSS